MRREEHDVSGGGVWSGLAMKLKAFLRKHDQFLVTAHVRPDGDALASVCFWCHLLHRFGKTFQAWVDGIPDERYHFLRWFQSIRNVESATDTERFFQAAVVLDTPSKERLGAVAHLLPTDREGILKIDHHQWIESFGGIEIVMPEMSSTCEILFYLAEALQFKLDQAAATALYSGICFDTGRFRFSNTKVATLAAAMELVKKGANPERIADRIFYQWSPLRVRMMGRILQEMAFHFDGRVAVTRVPFEFFRLHPRGHIEIEGFSDFGVSVKGVRISLFFQEIKPEYFKVSLRCVGDCDVSEIARRFGGGGHTKAAGCVLEGKFEDVSRRMLAVVGSALNAGSDLQTDQPHSE